MHAHSNKIITCIIIKIIFLLKLQPSLLAPVLCCFHAPVQFVISIPLLIMSIDGNRNIHVTAHTHKYIHVCTYMYVHVHVYTIIYNYVPYWCTISVFISLVSTHLYTQHYIFHFCSVPFKKKVQLILFIGAPIYTHNIHTHTCILFYCIHVQYI